MSERKIPTTQTTPGRQFQKDLLHQLNELEFSGIKLDQYQEGVKDTLTWVLGKGEQPECLN